MLLSADGKTLLEVDNDDIQPDGSYCFPDGITAIGDCAFNYCKKLQTLTIPASVISIGEEAFLGCHYLHTLTITNSVTSIKNKTFYDCRSLKKLTIPDGTASIGYGVFHGCHSLQTLTIPNSVISIGGDAFSDCWSLDALTIPKGVVSIECGTFNDCMSLKILTIPTSIKWIDPYSKNSALIIIDSDNEVEIERISLLIPKGWKNGVIAKRVFDEANGLRDAQLARLVQTPKTNALYRFFNYTNINRERAIEKQYGHLPLDIMGYMNTFLINNNSYYQKAKRLINREPWPKTKDELKVYEAKLIEIVNKCIEKLTEFTQPTINTNSLRR